MQKSPDTFFNSSRELYEIPQLTHPAGQLFEHHLGKIVFIGRFLTQLSWDSKLEIYIKLMEKINPITGTDIKVVSLVQGVGTSDPNITRYTFNIATYQILPAIDELPIVQLNPAGIPKEVKQVGDTLIISLNITNNVEQTPSHSENKLKTYKEKASTLLSK